MHDGDVRGERAGDGVHDVLLGGGGVHGELPVIREGAYDVLVGLVCAFVVIVAVVYFVVMGVAWVGMVIGDMVVG